MRCCCASHGLASVSHRLRYLHIEKRQRIQVREQTERSTLRAHVAHSSVCTAICVCVICARIKYDMSRDVRLKSEMPTPDAIKRKGACAFGVQCRDTCPHSLVHSLTHAIHYHCRVTSLRPSGMSLPATRQTPTYIQH